MPPPTLAFGHAALAQRIVAELVDSLQPGAGSSTEPALVVGVFGEWGAGKSRLLQHVGDELAAHGQQGGERALTVVVPFNAWRYEREEHLLIPLLRVAQQCLRKALEDSVGADIRHNETLSDRFALLGDLAQTVYEHGGRELPQAALAAQSVVLKLPTLKAEAGKAQLSAWDAGNWTDPEGLPGAATGFYAVRGGSFHGSFQQARSAAVDHVTRDQRRGDVGFRFIIRAKTSPGAEPA